MAVPYEKIVAEDLNLGYGPVTVTLPAGGTGRGHKIGLETFGGAINVMDRGARGDGIANDTSAIQGALDDGLLTAKAVHFPPGVYAVTQLRLYQHTHITGAGIRQTRILRLPSGTGPIITMASGERAIGITIENLQVGGGFHEGGTVTVADATDAAPIVVTTPTPHGLATTTLVNVASVLGNTAANGEWRITVLSDTTFSLDRSTGNGAYAGGGVVTVHTTGIELGIASGSDFSLGSTINNVVVFECTGAGYSLRVNAIGQCINTHSAGCRRGYIITGAVFYGFNMNSEDNTEQALQLEAFASHITGLQIEEDTGFATPDATMDVIEIGTDGCSLTAVYAVGAGVTRRSIIGLKALGPGFAVDFTAMQVTNAGGWASLTNLIADDVNGQSVPPAITHRTLAFYANGNPDHRLAPTLNTLAVVGPASVMGQLAVGTDTPASTYGLTIEGVATQGLLAHDTVNNDDMYLFRNDLGYGALVNAAYIGQINIRGYNKGFTQTRDLYIGDGKNKPILVTYGPNANVAIGNEGADTAPPANTVLKLDSTTAAFVPPRMTTGQRDAIAGATAGMVVFNSSTNKLNVRGVGGWEEVASA